MGWWKDSKSKREEVSSDEAVRSVVEFLTIFDWISPIIGFAETFVNDPTPLQSNSWTFFIRYDRALGAGWNEKDIRRLLSDNGVKSWGSMITNGELFFTVDVELARHAEYVLLRSNIPINERFIGAPAPKKKRGWFS